MKFARRTDWELTDNPLSLALKQRREQGLPVFDLTESNPTRAGIEYPPDLFLGAFNNKESLLYAPEPAGLLKARQAVAAYLNAAQARRQAGANTSPLAGTTQPDAIMPGNLTLTASTSEAYSFLFRLLADPGDRILLPAPSYPLFSYLADINDVEPVYYNLRFDGKRWAMDLDSIEQAARLGKVKAVVLVSPNNPTGSSISLDELKQLNALCTRYAMAIISDEVFSDYLFAGAREQYVSLAANSPVLSFALGGLSKALALPQMKLGWIAANGPADILSTALARLEVITDTFLSVNTPVQHACIEWLPQAALIQDQIMARITANLEALRAWAPRSGFELYPVAGGWYAVLKADLPLPEDEWAVELLHTTGVYVHPGFYFDFASEGYVVLSLLPLPETFRLGLNALIK
ncbi:MAG: pyridoxal phosphate-dependent aminotransferase [Candidatus Omnitrophica bacterium]|nr:pyridoxal phosphate-dependent aminotransferase [Candidatus Omnitrophota bacterium]